MILPPTLEQFAKYQAAWEFFIKALFGGKLQPCLPELLQAPWQLRLFHAESLDERQQAGPRD